MSVRRTIFLMLLGMTLLNLQGCATPDGTPANLERNGAGFFYFKDRAIPDGKAMRVFYYMPKRFNADRPVLFFMHGADRKAAHIPELAADTLEKTNILLILPEFSEALFPSVESYQYGNVRTKPRALWSFYINDRIFQRVRRLTGTRQQKYHIWGNSAGAQFVHRQILAGAHDFIKTAFVSNAGVYTLPIKGVDPYPYSIKGLDLTDTDLKSAFRLPLFVLLGEEDLTQDAYFLKSREAMKQGTNRFQRGRLFYDTARRVALDKKLAFDWRLVTIPGCGHNPNDEMMKIVIDAILSPNP